MSNEKALTTLVQKSLQIWEDLPKVRKIFAPNLTEDEFDFFVGLGVLMEANPFRKEIWAVKFTGNLPPDRQEPANIFLANIFYVRKAQEQPDYENHYPDAIYSNDEFVVVNGVPNHRYSLKDRGELLGAYCIVWKKGKEKPFYHNVKFSEYDKKQFLWKSHPETQIKKVAESQALRKSWAGVFKGTLGEAETVETAEYTDITNEDEIASMQEKLDKKTGKKKDKKNEAKAKKKVEAKKQIEQPKEDEAQKQADAYTEAENKHHKESDFDQSDVKPDEKGQTQMFNKASIEQRQEIAFMINARLAKVALAENKDRKDLCTEWTGHPDPVKMYESLTLEKLQTVLAGIIETFGE